MSDERTRIEIGFDGGLIVVTKLTDDGWSKLEAALSARTGTVQLDGEDETVLFVDVTKVSYVKRELHVGRVGF
ncbi:MAG: hypothetical protein ACTHNU_02140 [Gaiellales bacterium]